jgi:methionyl-tRNA formyltransferase
MIKVLFFGTSEFSVPSLRALVARADINVIAVVTQPDRPRGRKRELIPSPAKEAALELGLGVWQPEKVRAPEFVEKVEALQPDALVVAAFGQIIPKRLLDLPRLAPINVHGSLLPKYRGAAPIQFALMNGDAETGVTTMWMEPSLDTGDMLLQARLPIMPEDDYGTLLPKLADIGAPLLLETLDLLAQGNCPRIKQDEAEATLSPSIKMEHTIVHWNDPADKIVNLVRALSPRPGAISRVDGKDVKIWRATVTNGTEAPGKVVRVDSTGINVGTGRELVTIHELQASGSRRMAASDWARGVRLQLGAMFEQTHVV